MKTNFFYAMATIGLLAAGCTKKNVDAPNNQNTSNTSGSRLEVNALPPTNSWVGIINRNSGKSFNMPGGSIGDNVQVIQYTDGTGSNGRFKITSVGSNIYRITPSMPYGLTKCIEVGSGSTSDGAVVQQYEYHSGTNQQWRFTDMGSGYFQIVNVNSGKVIEVPGSSTANSTGLTQNTASATANNQQWKFLSKGPTTICTVCDGCTPWQSGYISGSWIMMHKDNNATIQSDGGASQYTVRYETEWWVGSGAIVPPTVQVISGTNTLTGTTGTSGMGSCTGTGFPQNANYSLNGTVKWTDNESGCAYNLAITSL